MYSEERTGKFGHSYSEDYFYILPVNIFILYYIPHLLGFKEIQCSESMLLKMWILNYPCLRMSRKAKIIGNVTEFKLMG